MLLGSLVIIYVFNLSRIPPDVTQGLRSLLVLLNLGFIGLILTAVAARFLFPLVSLEGRSFELLRLAPISMARYLWARLAGGLAPLIALGVGLVVACSASARG
jgi:ABC-2 type transport system permease protein